MIQKQTTYSISQLAAVYDISPRTIRFYEEKQLISPQRTAGGQRIYTQKERVRLKMILRGKRFGFSLDEIGEIIGMADMDTDEIHQIEKSLEIGKVKLEEIRRRKEELDLLEQDMLAISEKLCRQLQELKNTHKN